MNDKIVKYFSELKNFSLEDDNYLDLEHEDLINTATKQKDKSKLTKKEKKDKEVSKVINKLKKANKKKIKKVQDTSEDNVVFKKIIDGARSPKLSAVTTEQCLRLKRGYSTMY
ncbi:hypothetical protein RR46_00702 [Papilio xuthus]|uniref:Uncharacterized protein n=1 Tax=Papilio xuthus TaxID=66420 RepID=A0A0N1IJ34_PAPXU|nr:hypothetical protein RR46_00702 [Papilio xuthus]